MLINLGTILITFGEELQILSWGGNEFMSDLTFTKYLFRQTPQNHNHIITFFGFLKGSSIF